MDIINKQKDTSASQNTDVSFSEKLAENKRRVSGDHYISKDYDINHYSTVESMSAMLDRVPTNWETFKLQFQDSLDNGLTPIILRNTPLLFDEHERETLNNLAAKEHNFRSKLLENSNSWVAKLAGGISASVADPVDLGAMVVSGGASNVALQGVKFGASAITKRIASNALTGFGYGAITEGIRHFDDAVDHGNPLVNIASDVVLFPVLGEGAHQIGKIFGMGIPKTKSPYLNNKIDKLNNTTAKQFVDESVIDYKNIFQEKYHKQLDDIIKPKTTSDGLINDVEKLQEIKEALRHDFSNKSDALKAITLLEDKIGLTDKESALLQVLKENNNSDVIIRDNLIDSVDILITNRKLQHDGLSTHPNYESIVEHQANQGIKINSSNTSESELVFKNSTEPVLSKSAEDIIIKNEDINIALDDTIKKIEQGKVNLTDKTILQEIDGQLDIYKYQMSIDKKVASDLYNYSKNMKDLTVASKVSIGKRDMEAKGMLFSEVNTLNKELSSNGLLELFEEYPNIWAHEMSLLNGAKHATHPKSNDAFKAIAKILNEPRKRLLARAQRAGIDINELTGYVVKQTHDKRKLKDVGFNKWRDFISPLLDKAKTDISEESLRKSYNHIMYGKTIEDGVEIKVSDSVKPILHSMGVNIGKKRSRSLHFSNIENAYIYNNQFGQHKWSHQYLKDLDSLTNIVSTAEHFGVHPEHVMKYVTKKLMDDGVEIPQDLVNKTLDLVIKGRNTYDINDTAAIFGQNLRKWKSVTALGQMLLSSLPDIVGTVNTLHTVGAPVLQSIGQAFKSVGFMVAKQDRKKWLELTSAVLDGSMKDMYGRMALETFTSDIGGQTSKYLSKMSGAIYKLSGMELWDASVKTGTAQGLSKFVYTLKKSTYDKLPIGLQNAFKENSIDKKIWDIIRRSKTSEEGYIIPENIIDKEIRSKYQGFLIDLAHKATSSPIKSTDQQFLRTGLSKANPIVREIWLSTLQFKTFPIMFVRHQLAPLFKKFVPLEKQSFGGNLGGGVLKDFIGTDVKSKSSVISWFSGLAMSILALDYLSGEIKNITSGKKTFDNAFDLADDDIKKVLERGSFLGIYQSLINGLTGEDNYFFLPPNASIIKDAASITSKIGDEDFIPNVIHKGKRNVPFNNLFYVNGLINKGVENYIKNEYPAYYRKKLKKGVK